MKRFAIWLVFSGILFPSTACSQSAAVVATVSPSNARSVSIQRRFSESRTQVVLETTDLKTGKSKELRSPIYYEGVFDPGFEQYYSDHKWLAENVLWLGYDLGIAKHSITIENRGSSTVDCLQIRTEDLYFVFDLHANERIIVPLTWTDNKGKNVSFTVIADTPKGAFVESRQFPVPKTNSASYLISIAESEGKIEISSDDGLNRPTV